MIWSHRNGDRAMIMNLVLRGAAVAGIAIVALVGFARGPASAAEILRFGAYGGGLLEAQKEYLGAPFEILTGATIEWTAATEEIFANKLIAANGKSPPFDVVMLDEPWSSLVRVQGLAEKLDSTRVPPLRNVKKEFLVPDNEGVCLFSFTSGIVYNKEKFKE